MSGRKAPVIVVFGRLDTPRRSMRVQRETIVDDDGPNPRLSIALYTPLAGGRFARERWVDLKRCEAQMLLKGLTLALKDEPILDPQTGGLL